jgi:hypothetical protein
MANRFDITVGARNEASAVFNRVGQDGKQMGTAVGASFAALKGHSDGATKGVGALGAALGQAGKQADGAGRSAGGFGAALMRAGKQGENAAGGTARALMGARQQIDGATKDTGRLGAAFDSVKGKLGAGIAVGALQMLSTGLIKSGNEASLLGAKMEAALKGVGQSGASQELQKVSIALAGLTGGDDDEIGAKLGAGIASGKLRSLQELGIYLNDAEQASIKAASAQGELAEAAARTDAVLSASRRTIENLAATTPDAAKKMGEFAVAFGNAQEVVGQGAANARASWQAALTPILEGLSENHKGLLEVTGATLEYANVAATVATPIWTVAEALLAMRNAANLAKLARIAEAGATATATLATEANTAANLKNAASGVGGKGGLVKGLLGGAAGVAGAVGGGLVLGSVAYEATRDEETQEGIGEQLSKPGENLARLGGRLKTWALQDDVYAHDNNEVGKWAEGQSARILAESKARRAKGSAAAALAGAAAPTVSAPFAAAPMMSAPSVFPTASTSSQPIVPPALRANRANVADALAKGASLRNGVLRVPNRTLGSQADEDALLKTLQERQSGTVGSGNASPGAALAGALDFLKNGGDVFRAPKGGRASTSDIGAGSRSATLTVRPKTRTVEQGSRLFLEILPERVEINNSLMQELGLL